MYKIIDFLYNYGIPSKLALKTAVKFNDKIFFFAEKIEESNTSTNIFINSNNCLVFLNDKIKEKFIQFIEKQNINSEKIQQIPTIHEIRSQQKPGILISASVIVLDKKNRILLLKRDHKAPVEANKWQIPGGRMDITHPMYVAKAEIDQEITILNKNQKKQIITSEFINDDDLNKHQINIIIDQKLIHITHTIKIHDRENSTIELFYPTKLNIESKDLYCRDNEFSREVNFFTLNEINRLNIPLVTYLEKYQKEIFSQINFKKKILEAFFI